jgi:hypothetical protein
MEYSQSVYTLFDLTDANRDLQGHETGNMEKLSCTFPSSLVIINAGSYNSGVIVLHHIDIFEPLLLIGIGSSSSYTSKTKTHPSIRTNRTINHGRHPIPTRLRSSTRPHLQRLPPRNKTLAPRMRLASLRRRLRPTRRQHLLGLHSRPILLQQTPQPPRLLLFDLPPPRRPYPLGNRLRQELPRSVGATGGRCVYEGKV